MRECSRWTKEMDMDIYMLYPYINAKALKKIINKKHKSKKTICAIESRAKYLSVKKEYSDGICIIEAAKEIGCPRKKIGTITKSMKIKKHKRGSSFVISFFDFERIRSEYADYNSGNFLSIKDILNYGKKVGMGRTCIYKNILCKCKPYRNIKDGSKETLYIKNFVMMYFDFYLNGKESNFCLTQINSFHINDIQEYYSITQVAKMLGVSRKVLSDRCNGDISTVHPDIKYVKGKGGCMPTARIPMRAIEAVFDKLNEGWSYKGC